MVPLRKILKYMPFVILAVAAGCGLLKDPDNSLFFYPNALVPKRLLIGINLVDNPDAPLALATLQVISGGDRRYTYLDDGTDHSSPAMSADAQGQWIMVYGKGQIQYRHCVTGIVTGIPGSSTSQIAPAFNHGVFNQMAYMDGSAAGGYNITIQPGPGGSPSALTTDASASLSYWTPSFSRDGQWLLYTKVTGTTGADAELWRVHPDGTGAEMLPITATELPQYAVFNPDGTEILVPSDMTSYLVSDGSVGFYDDLRSSTAFLADLDALGVEFVGSPLTGPLHPGDETTAVRHGFALSVEWAENQNDRLYFDALVANRNGDAPHEVLGVAVFSWQPFPQILRMHLDPMPISEARSAQHQISVIHPTVLP